MGTQNQYDNAPSQDAYPQPTAIVKPVTDPLVPKADNGATPSNPLGEFPTKEQNARIQDYDYYNRLFSGDHFGAFNIRIGDDRYTREYSKLRYVMANFAGLISKVCADMLFSESPDFTTEDGDQEFIDALVDDNNLNIQNYESALSNSYYGDAIYKVRIGKRHPSDEKPTVIIEDITPVIYFPKVDGFNVRGIPVQEELAWTFKVGETMYLRKEIHEPGKITNEVYLMEGQKIMKREDISILGLGLSDFEETKINQSLLVHIPNWKTGNRYFGISDYFDLDRLFYAINNRLTKIDNILDKHGDPILTVPPGVLDEHGNVRKKALGVLEIAEGETGKPEYITWDASLDNAFKEIDNLIQSIMLIGEISPDTFGLAKSGTQDSGRAIKLRLLRTIAKVTRKRLYYDRGLKQVLYIAQLLAKAWDVEVQGKKLTKEPVFPEIMWQDGLPVDNAEQVDIESKRLADGNTSLEDSIMRLDGVDEDTAKNKAEAIRKQNKIDMPMSNVGKTPFGANDPRSKQNPDTGKKTDNTTMNNDKMNTTNTAK